MKGIWTALSGSVAQSQNLDNIANNLANSDTVGFRKDQATFGEVLAVKTREPLDAQIPYGKYKDSDFYPLDSRDKSLVEVDGVHTSFKQGHLRVTGSPLDLAMDGPGFFEVLTPKGVLFTRGGNFKVNQDGLLTTMDGYPVLSRQPRAVSDVQLAQGRAPAQAAGGIQGGIQAEQGPVQEEGVEMIPPTQRTISLNGLSVGKLSVTEDGDVYSGDQLVDSIGMVEFKDTSALKKVGGLMFENPDEGNFVTGRLSTRMKQGLLETSNVNPVSELVDMMKATRLFEANQKALKAYGDMMRSDLGKLGN